jgi:DNA-binding transcriptional LysR family regulator
MLGAAVELRDIDLNLLVLFNELMNCGRMNVTAGRLGVTQPAVSNGLARLRRLLGDELFVRTPQGMQPTPFAAALAGPVSQALAAIHGALNRSAAFDPLTSSRNFTIAMTDIGEIDFLPDLMGRLGREAPGVTLSTVRNYAIDLVREMEAGQVDLAIGLLPDLKAGFFQRGLFTQRYVCLFRKGHALDRGSMTLEDFTGAEHIRIVASGTGHGMTDAHFERLGIARRIRLMVPHFVAVGHILRGSDMIATVPEALAERVAGPFELSWCAHPVPLPEIAIVMYWHSKFHRDAASQWLRGFVAAAKSPSPPIPLPKGSLGRGIG